MHQILKRLLAPLALLVAAQIPTVGAEAIKVVGPDGQIQSSPQYSQPIGRAAQSTSAAASTYGPTKQDETLWSIATRLRPNDQLSVQQTLLAIYRLNPQAFENQNIHELIPGSKLRIPSQAQVQDETTQEAIRLMNEHRAKLNRERTGAPRAPRAVAAQPVTRPQPAPVKEEAPKETVTVATTLEKKAQITEKEVARDKAIKAQRPTPEVVDLKRKLTDSKTELEALEEKNHQLRLMLSDVQGEVDYLKDELGDESRIRSEIEKMLEEERKRKAQEQAMQPTMLETLLKNKLALVLLALIPGLLLVLIIITLMNRKGKQEEPVVEQPQEQEAVSLMVDDVPEINLDDDLDDDLLGDDLLGGGDEESLDAFSVDEGDEPSEEDDIFANLSESEFNLDDGPG